MDSQLRLEARTVHDRGCSSDSNDGTTMLSSLRSSTASSFFSPGAGPGEDRHSSPSKKRLTESNLCPSVDATKRIKEEKKPSGEKRRRKSSRKSKDGQISGKRKLSSVETHKLAGPSPDPDGNCRQNSSMSPVIECTPSSELRTQNENKMKKRRDQKGPGSSSSNKRRSRKSMEPSSEGQPQVIVQLDKVVNDCDESLLSSRIDSIEQLEQELKAGLNREQSLVKARKKKRNEPDSTKKTGRKQSGSKRGKRSKEMLTEALADSSMPIDTTQMKRIHRREKNRPENLPNPSNSLDSPLTETRDDVGYDPEKGSKKKTKHRKKSSKDKSKNSHKARLGNDDRGSSDTVTSGKEVGGSASTVGKKAKKMAKEHSIDTTMDKRCDDIVKSAEKVGGTAQKASKKDEGCKKGKNKTKAREKNGGNGKSEPIAYSSSKTIQSRPKQPRSGNAKTGTPKSVLSPTHQLKSSSRDMNQVSTTNNLQPHSPSAEANVSFPISDKKVVSFRLIGESSSPPHSRDGTSDASPTKTSLDSRLDEAVTVQQVPTRKSTNNKLNFQYRYFFFRRKSSGNLTENVAGRESRNGSLHPTLVTFNSCRSLQATEHEHRRGSIGVNGIFRGSLSSTNTTSSPWYLRSEGIISTDTTAGLSSNHSMMEMIFFDSIIRDK
jgi:hypothetical protein